MYNIQLGKAVISFLALITLNLLNEFYDTIHGGGFLLVILGLTGALGQVFVFLTISKFGALNCALIGLGRKMLTLLLSFLLYGHDLNGMQIVGLALSIAAMVANFFEKGGNKHKANDKDKQIAPEEEQVSLLTDNDNENNNDSNSKSNSNIQLTAKV